MWHERKTWSYLELLPSTKRRKCYAEFFFFYNLSLYQNKRVTVIVELRAENVEK